MSNRARPRWSARKRLVFVYGRRLLTGLLALLAAWLVPSFWPSLDRRSYDSLLSTRRQLGQKLNSLFPNPGLHRSIVLLGDQGDAPLTGEKGRGESLQKLASYGASGVTWVDGPPGEARQHAGVVVLPGVSQHEPGASAAEAPLVFYVDPVDDVLRGSYLALSEAHGWKPCLPLRLYARFLGDSECRAEVHGQTLILNGKQQLPVQVDATGAWMALTPYLSQVSFGDSQEAENSFATESTHPVSWSPLWEGPHPLMGARASGRFFFAGAYDRDSTGERSTPTGPFRNFQLAGMALDNLIQGPRVRLWTGWRGTLIILLLGAGYSLWFLRPAPPWLLAGRALLAFTLGRTLALLAIFRGEYLPSTWWNLFVLFLLTAAGARAMVDAARVLRRYGGGAAVALLTRGTGLSGYGAAHERVATIVFLGLPDHLRQLEQAGDPRTLAHRKLFSALVSDVVHDLGGLVHDHQADYLMLGFGTQPEQDDPEHAEHALEAAHELVALRQALAERWQCSSEAARLQVSLNSGPIAVGWVGAARQKLAAAAIGDTTNVAARLLGTAKKLGLNVVLSATTRELLGAGPGFVKLEPVRLKGKSEAVEIYRLDSSRP